MERCSSSHKCLATLLKIGQFLEPTAVDHKQDELVGLRTCVRHSTILQDECAHTWICCTTMIEGAD